MSADFGARSLGFASSGTTVNGAAAPSLDLRGALTYAPGQGRFSGSVANASGSLRGSTSGQFYGPRAEELGGVFVAAGTGAESGDAEPAVAGAGAAAAMAPGLRSTRPVEPASTSIRSSAAI